VATYLFVRFGIAQMIRKYTVHRGMFHSIPACLIFGGIAFLLSGSAPIEIRCYKSVGVLLGFMSHLLLDEIYAVQWKGGRWRFKKSFGTALKLWSDDRWANFSTYTKLFIVVMMILGEPAVMERLEANHPRFANQVQQWQDQFGSIHSLPGAQQTLEAARSATQQYFGASGSQSVQTGMTAPPSQNATQPPASIWNDRDTAQRAAGRYPQ